MKKGYRRSVTGRIYSGLKPSVRKRLEAKIKERSRTRIPTKSSVKSAVRKAGRPQKYAYDSGLVKQANERLRKIEKVYKLTEDSNEYRMVRKYATEYPNGKGQIYKLGKDGSIRFISKTEYEKLDKKYQRYFNEVLRNFLQASTTTKAGIEDKYERSYNTFMQNYGQSYPALTLEDYKAFFKVWRDQVTEDKKNHYDYDTLAQIITNIDISSVMTAGDMDKVIQYVATENWHKIKPKYRLNN